MSMRKGKRGVKDGVGMEYGADNTHGPNGEGEGHAQGIEGLSEDEKHGVYGGKQWMAGSHTHGFGEHAENKDHPHTIGGGVREFWKGHGMDKSSCEDNADGSHSGEAVNPFE